MVSLWRIATETRQYRADDLSGAGAAKRPGRWNAEGQPVVYCACSRSLAVLETAAHLGDGGLPMNRYLIQIDIAPAIWRKRKTLAPQDLDAAWNAIPAGSASIHAGSKWLLACRSALLLVPSVLVPEEQVVLVNPAHPDAAAITAKTVRKFDYNLLFRS